MITSYPTQPPHWAPTPSPSPSPSPAATTTTILHQPSRSPPSSKLPIDFRPPLIAMVVIVATAFLVVTYYRLLYRHLLPLLRRYRRWLHRRRRLQFLPSSSADLDSPPFDPSTFQSLSLSPFGLDDSTIKTLPLTLFTTTNNNNIKDSKDCAVCLLEFEENDYVRTLPVCAHAFHVDCIDIWLRSHANCPLCRAGIFLTGSSPFIPVMAARIRPSFDEDAMLTNMLSTLTESPLRSFSTVTEIAPESPRRLNVVKSNLNSEERFNGRDMLLKRSYSFGFERSLAAERMMMAMEPATASPCRFRRGGFWSKRPSPLGSLTKSRVFSFRHYRGIKSPFFRRRGFFPLSERFVNGGGGGVSSSRRSKSMTSPMFMRSSALGVAPFSSSRLRCGDPEALLSPERFNRR
ncbi:zf-RING_2 domain-containing protein [Cephalotus follicularis]|uniref:RING-type E3 ubiquitin transferase n=1 Tax=Cephalotus follicularis TaxID=3775 RepID=A0A1Q3CMQ3_CEPFO|nr:zf-RING_2 domain-containing protein [Cephalotus follicularis]